MINARAESLAEKSAYKRAFQQAALHHPRRRVLRVEEDPGPEAQAADVHPAGADGEPLAFAGLWELWKPKETAGRPESPGSAPARSSPASPTRSSRRSTTACRCMLPPSAWDDVARPRQRRPRHPRQAARAGAGRAARRPPGEPAGQQRARRRPGARRAVRPRRRRRPGAGDPAVVAAPPPGGRARPRPPGLLVGSPAGATAGSTGCCCAGRPASTPAGPTGSCRGRSPPALFVVYAAVALARVDRLDAGTDLARHVQAAWQLAEGRPPELDDRRRRQPLRRPPARRSSCPLAALTRVLPTTGDAARRPGGRARRRRRAAVAAGPQGRPTSGSAPPLALAARLRLPPGRRRPRPRRLQPAGDGPVAAARRRLLRRAPARGRRFAVAAVVAVLWSSELGLVDRRDGRRPHRRGGAAHRAAGRRRRAGVDAASPSSSSSRRSGAPGSSRPARSTDYGDGGLEVLIEMLRNPFRPVGDLLGAEETSSSWCGCWPRCCSCRCSACASWRRRCRCTALVLVADVPAAGRRRRRPHGAARRLRRSWPPPFALARLGRPSVERVIVDRRLLGLARPSPPLAALLDRRRRCRPTAARGRSTATGEEARRGRRSRPCPPVVAGPGARRPRHRGRRAPRGSSSSTPGERDPAAPRRRRRRPRARRGRRTPDLGPAERHALRRAIEADGMVQVRPGDGIVAFVRILEDGVLLRAASRRRRRRAAGAVRDLGRFVRRRQARAAARRRVGGVVEGLGRARRVGVGRSGGRPRRRSGRRGGGCGAPRGRR